MSIDIDWQALDDQLAQRLVERLNDFFAQTKLPAYLGAVEVLSLNWGDHSPSIELLNITDLSRDFIDPDLDDGDRSSDGGRSMRSISISDESSFEHSLPSEGSTSLPSLQLNVRVQYTGNMRIHLKTSLLVNYPSPLFMALPLSMTLSGLALNATFIVAFEGDRRKLHLSIDPRPAFVSPEISPSGSFYGMMTPPLHTHWSSTTYNKPRPADVILSKLQMETEVGQADKHVLRNVTKVEKFVLECARSALEAEIIWPAFQTIAY